MRTVHYFQSYKMGDIGMVPDKTYVYNERKRIIENVKAGDMIKVSRYKNSYHKRTKPNEPLRVDKLIALTDAQPYAKSTWNQKRWKAWGGFICKTC